MKIKEEKIIQVLRHVFSFSLMCSRGGVNAVLREKGQLFKGMHERMLLPPDIALRKAAHLTVPQTPECAHLTEIFGCHTVILAAGQSVDKC